MVGPREHNLQPTQTCILIEWYVLNRLHSIRLHKTLWSGVYIFPISYPIVTFSISGVHSHYSVLRLHAIISSIKASWFTVKLRATEWHLAVCHAKRTNYPTLDCAPELFSWHSCRRYKETTESCVSFIFFSSEQETSVAVQRYKSSFPPNQDKAINGQRKEDRCCFFFYLH